MIVEDIKKENYVVLYSREIRPLVALYPLSPGPGPPHTKTCFMGLRYRSPLSVVAGSVAHVYGICAPFYCISLKNYGGGV